MAYKIVPFYNVDSAVGEIASNRADDVALVRFFLRRIGEAPDIQIPALASLPINTSAGPDLFNAIRAFQEEVQRRGHACAQDGRVDTAQNIGHGTESTLSHTGYTIGHLNATYRNRYPDFHNDLTKDSKLPGILTPIFGSHQFGY